MKIAILTHPNFPLKEPYAGGLEMITHRLVQELESSGYHVDVYAPEGSEVRNLIAYEKVEIDTQAMEEFSHRCGNEDEVRTSLIYSKVFEKIGKMNYDIIHNHSHHFLPIVLGNQTKTPFITTFHTPMFPDLKLALSYLGGEYNQQFTMVSSSLKEQYAEYIANAAVIYNGINIDQWEFRSSEPDDYCIWYGRICKEKAPHLAIEAAILANTKILLAGPGEESDYFKEKVQPLITGNPSLVKYLGHLDQENLGVYLKKARAFLFTSIWDEPYGLAIAESLACGTPVLSWDKGAAPEILTPDCGSLIPFQDTKKMAEALLSYDKFSRKACRQRAEDFCDIQSMVKSYKNFYERIALKKASLC